MLKYDGKWNSQGYEEVNVLENRPENTICFLKDALYSLCSVISTSICILVILGL